MAKKRKQNLSDPNQSVTPNMSSQSATSSDPDYKAMILAAYEYNKKQHERWNSNIKLYKGEVTEFRKMKLRTWAHLVEVNLTRPTIDTMLPNLIFRTPKVNVRPSMELSDQQTVMAALNVENQINAIQVELDLAEEYVSATKDALLTGIGWVRYGMTTDYAFDKDDYAFPAPSVRRWSPWDVWPDPISRDQWCRDAGYMCFRYFALLSDAKSDKTLSNRDKLQAVGIIDALPTHLKENLEKDKVSGEYCEMIEVWDRQRGVIKIMDRQGNEYQSKEIPEELIGLFPAVPIRLNSVPDEFYSKGEPEFLYSYQLEMSEKRTQMLNHTRRFNRKYQVPRDADKDDVDALIRGDDGTVVRTNNPITPIADAPLSVDLYREIDAIWKEAQEVTGIAAYQRGGNESAVYSATAAKIIDAAANIKIEFHRDRVKKAIEKGCRLLYKILQPIKGWPQIEFNYNVDVSTMQRPDDEGRRQQLIQFAGVAKEFPEFKRQQWLVDFALAFMKPPQQYVYSEQEMQAIQSQQANPEAQKAQMEMQMMQMKAQMEMQARQSDLQIQQQSAQMDMQMKQAEMQFKMMMMQKQIEFEQAKVEVQREILMMNANAAEHKMNISLHEKAQGIQLKKAEAEVDAECCAEEHEMDMEHKAESHKADMKMKKSEPKKEDD